MKLLRLVGVASLVVALPASASETGGQTNLDRLGAALVSGNETAAKSLLSSDAKIISYFNKEFRLENLQVLIANFKGRSQIEQNPKPSYLAYDVCSGTTAFVLQVKEDQGKIIEVRYGTLGFSPLPMPYTMWKSVDRCKPPVRIVGAP